MDDHPPRNPGILLRQGAAEDAFREGPADTFQPPPIEELLANLL